MVYFVSCVIEGCHAEPIEAYWAAYALSFDKLRMTTHDIRQSKDDNIAIEKQVNLKRIK